MLELEASSSRGFGGSYLRMQSVSVCSSMPSKVESKSKEDRSEFTLSCSALTRALVIGPLGGLGGVDVGVDTTFDR